MKTHQFEFSETFDIGKFIGDNGLQAESENILIQVFTGVIDKKSIQKVQETLVNFFPNAHIVGATTAGEILEGKILKESTVVSVTSFENTKVRSALIAHDEKPNSAQLGKKVAEGLITENTKVILSFSDGLNTNGEEYVTAIGEVNPEVVVAGGMAGDNLKFEKTYIFDKSKIIDSGAVAVSLSNPDLQVATRFNFNWKNIGKELKITKSEGNVLYTLDGEKATDIYRKYLGDEIADRLPNSGIQYPLIMDRNGMKTARAVLNADKDTGSLTLAGSIHEGEKVQLGYANVSMILADAESFYESMEQQPIESLFVYSCCARWMFLGNNALNREVSPLASIAPTNGFYTYGEFFHSEGSNKLLNETMTVLALSESQENHEKEIIVPDNTELSEQIITLNALSHLSNVVTDELTELKNNLEDTVMEQTSQLQESYDKLKELDKRKDEFVGIVSHELRTPLTVINGYTTWLLQNLPEASKEQEVMLKKIQRNIDHLIEMVNNMLDIKRLEAGGDKVKNVPVDLSGVLQLVYSDMFLEAKRNNIEFILAMPENPVEILGDEQKIRQVLVNLIGNSIKFSSDEVDSQVGVSIEETDDDFIQINVWDNGIGMPKDQIGEIFDKFQQVSDKPYKKVAGSGLGLTICKHYVESMNGKIWAESSPENGTTLSFTLKRSKNGE